MKKNRGINNRKFNLSKEKINTKYLLKILEGRESKLWMQAATQLTRTSNKRFMKRLLSIMLSGKNPKQREAAAYALSHSPSYYNQLLHKYFSKVLQNISESPSVRAQVAEGMGNLYCYADKRTKYYKEAVNVLISCLKDRSPEVRFWSVFALGSMRAKKALPVLHTLAKADRGFCPGWWSIKDEAKDAINVILGGEWPDRIPARNRRRFT